MGDALCLKFTDPTFLDAQGVMCGAVFLRFRASPVVPCSSGLGRHVWCGVPEVQGVIGVQVGRQAA